MKTLNILFSLLMMALSILAFTPDTIAQSQQKISKVYVATVYGSDKNKVQGILYSVDDSSIRLCIDTAFTKNDPLSESLKMIIISYQDIRKIKVFKKGALGAGLVIGALAGGIPGFMAGAVADAASRAVVTVISFGTVETEPHPEVAGFCALAGLTMGGVLGLAVGSSSTKYFQIDHSLEKYNTEKEGLNEYSIIKANLSSLNEVQQIDKVYYNDLIKDPGL